MLVNFFSKCNSMHHHFSYELNLLGDDLCSEQKVKAANHVNIFVQPSQNQLLVTTSSRKSWSY